MSVTTGVRVVATPFTHVADVRVADAQLPTTITIGVRRSDGCGNGHPQDVVGPAAVAPIIVLPEGMGWPLRTMIHGGVEKSVVCRWKLLEAGVHLHFAGFVEVLLPVAHLYQVQGEKRHLMSIPVNAVADILMRWINLVCEGMELRNLRQVVSLQSPNTFLKQ